MPTQTETVWEPVCTELTRDGIEETVTDRLAVPGGWLYRTRAFADVAAETGVVAVALTFVPSEVTHERQSQRHQG